MTDPRGPRDPRGTEDPRDRRDVRRPDDPRDPRDPRDERIPGDPRDSHDGDGNLVEHALSVDDVQVVPSRPRRWWVAVTTVFVVAAVPVVVAWQLADVRADEERARQEQAEREEQARCERSVAARDDNRAMWLSLAELFPESEEVELLLTELAERLPRLECVNRLTQPIGD
jgi:hypothetical protein